MNIRPDGYCSLQVSALFFLSWATGELIFFYNLVRSTDIVVRGKKERMVSWRNESFINESQDFSLGFCNRYKGASM